MNLRLLLPLTALMTLGGCLVVRTPPPTRSATRVVVVKERRDCRPNEYWDGDRCVHKGKGKGHDKHDKHGKHRHHDHDDHDD
ncbi:hypothetical protein P2318_28940 [Myxococcaceae bacterium GXIMD 01537]